MRFVVPPRSSITTGQQRDSVRRRVREPEKRRLALAALDAFDRVCRVGKLRASDLAAITEAACSRYTPVWYIGTDMLMRVACQYHEGQEAIRQILKSGPANARFQVTAAITGDLPKAFAKEIICIALCDKGSRVRDKAAEACGRLRLKELLPKMESRLSIEQNQTVRNSLKFFIAMLRDGYLLTFRDGDPVLWVQTPQGCCCPALTQEEIDAGKMPALIAKIKKGLFP